MLTTVRLLMAQSGAAESWPAGALYECDDAIAARLVAEGRAVRLAPLATVASETAMAAPAPERAMKPRGKGRG